MSSRGEGSGRDTHTAAQVPERTRQRIFRVPVDQGIPEGWHFAQWLGKESVIYPPYWVDVVLCEVDDDNA